VSARTVAETYAWARSNRGHVTQRYEPREGLRGVIFIDDIWPKLTVAEWLNMPPPHAADRQPAPHP
jgi:hypothetical protein